MWVCLGFGGLQLWLDGMGCGFFPWEGKTMGVVFFLRKSFRSFDFVFIFCFSKGEVTFIGLVFLVF